MFHHAAHIVSPHRLFDAHNRLVQREAVLLAVVVGGDHAHLTIVAFRAADHRLVIDGARQHEAVVIVGVFADQVDAARRLNSVGRLVAKLLPENLLGGFF